MFSVEECPEVELANVRDVFEKHQHLIQQLYTPYRANIKHAMTLDGLWHVVKILRLPRDIHVIPTLRDEELVANGYEQLFSPEDLGELFLQLCNEQFLPQIATLDWQAFIQDYRLLRARFLMEQAMNVFRNVQEATPGNDDQLELIYSEFCEALVGVAMFYVPDPFMKTATKVTQFLRRYLPLSPDDVHDHA
ncbi:hypothetical protein BBJ29_001859 [Phytophthora kernoviae]|uniref:Uncharacterized protein n=1 Tax=Phytophthora kernoviae TaxID=325452 RepID=A0A3F2S355_9STRA|nr:hypothetical protein BBJ29_001859 [Phytophthora kernoviae]RLN69374.1 hypothetical protein BBP00_00000373 [Phytophthora kernoviae]